MDLKTYSQPHVLERYSFLWSEARLVCAAFALMVGGIPTLRYFVRAQSLYGLVGLMLTFAWIISGVASAYLLYRWNAGGRKLFGGTTTQDRVLFFISVISGLNLGIVGLFRVNIGMSLMSGSVIFMVVGLLYACTAGYLYQRWNRAGRKLFG